MSSTVTSPTTSPLPPAATLRQDLLRFVARRVSDPADAEDLVQDILLRAHRAQDSLVSRESVHAWLYRIARGVIADYWAKSARANPAELPELAADPPATPYRQELAGCVASLARELPEPYRETILLSELEELPHKTIADRLDLSVSAVKSRVQRGREKLKQKLLACCEVEFERGEIESRCRHAGEDGGCPCGESG